MPQQAHTFQTLLLLDHVSVSPVIDSAFVEVNDGADDKS